MPLQVTISVPSCTYLVKDIYSCIKSWIDLSSLIKDGWYAGNSSRNNYFKDLDVNASYTTIIVPYQTVTAEVDPGGNRIPRWTVALHTASHDLNSVAKDGLLLREGSGHTTVSCGRPGLPSKFATHRAALKTVVRP